MLCILAGLMMLGVGLWYVLPYMLVMGQKPDIESKIQEDTLALYNQVSALSQSNTFVRQYFTSWIKEWQKFQIKQRERKTVVKEKEEGKGKELEMLTYTKKQQEKIDTSALAGYIAQYRKLKLFFLVFYAPVILITLFYAILLAVIKRTEMTERMQPTSENLQKFGYVGVLLTLTGFFIFFVVCPEVLMKNTINISLPVGVLTFLLAVSIYPVVANMPQTQETTPGK